MVRQWLLNVWQKSWGDNDELLTVNVTRNSEDMRALKDDLGNTPSYPYSTITIGNIDIDTDKGGMSKKFIPVVTGRSENSDMITSTNMVPVKIGLGVNFRTDNLDQVLNLAHILVFNAPRIVLRLSNDSGFVYECGVSIDPALVIPQADMGYVSKEFRFEFTLILSTWFLREKAMGVIRQVRFEMVDSGGVTTPLGTFDEITKLTERRLNYRDLFDKNSNRYRAE